MDTANVYDHGGSKGKSGAWVKNWNGKDKVVCTFTFRTGSFVKIRHEEWCSFHHLDDFVGGMRADGVHGWREGGRGGGGGMLGF